MAELCEAEQYKEALKNEQRTGLYPNALNLSNAEPGFIHPFYFSDEIKEFDFTKFGRLNHITEDFETEMRQFLANKIGADVHPDNFVYSLSIFRILKSVLKCLPHLDNQRYSGKKTSTVVLSPQGCYYLFNRIAGSVIRTDDCIQTVWTYKDERYKLCADDIDKWVKENKHKFEDRPLILIFENPSVCGHLYDETELREIYDTCRHHDIFIFTDEIYRETHHPGEKFTSLGSVVPYLDGTISAYALSKGYGNLQYSLSFARMSPQLADLCNAYVGDDWRSTTLYHNAIAQKIFREDNAEYLEKARHQYKEKTAFVISLIHKMNEDLEKPVKIIHEPQAGYAIVVDFTQSILGVREFEVDHDFKHHWDFFTKCAEAGVVIQSMHAAGVRNRLCFRIVYGRHNKADLEKSFETIKSVIKSYES